MIPRPGKPIALACFFCLTCVSLLTTPALAAGKDACTLLTAADAQAALGEPVGPPRNEPRPSSGGEVSACKYRSTQGSALSAKSVTLTVHYADSDISGSDAGMADSLKSAGMKNVHAVSGVGDAAVWASNTSMGRPMGELTVRKGKSVMLTIIITGMSDDAAALEHAKALALKLVPQV